MTAETETPVTRKRFICASSKHDPPKCTYESDVRWVASPCPGCGMWWGPIPQRLERADGGLATAADSTAPSVQVKRIKSGVDGFDYAIGGGLVSAQTILLAGPAGSRKTSIALLVADGLTKNTSRPVVFASAEQNKNGVFQMCQLVGVTGADVKIMGSVDSIDTVLTVCDENRPVLAVFDSLQGFSANSGVNIDAVAKYIIDYCKRTNMIGIIINQFTNEGAIKGGTGPSHWVDTLVVIDPWIYGRKRDGDPIEAFGKDIAEEIKFDPDKVDVGDKVENIHVVVGGAFAKNRYGEPEQKAYFCTTKGGGLKQIEKIDEKDSPEDDLSRARKRKRKRR